MDGRRRVVVVDDDADLRELVVQVVTDLGFEAVAYADGAAALEGLRGPGNRDAVILLDLEMPGMTGWEFREAQRHDPLLAHLPVVVASSASRRSIDADAYLPKPYGIVDLCEVLARLSLRAPAEA